MAAGHVDSDPHVAASGPSVPAGSFVGHMHSLGAGALMGVIHALTGPDHMSALITLSVNNRCAAAFLGIRWGVGHSTGLLIVTGMVLILRDAFGYDPRLQDTQCTTHTVHALAYATA